MPDASNFMALGPHVSSTMMQLTLQYIMAAIPCTDLIDDEVDHPSRWVEKLWMFYSVSTSVTRLVMEYICDCMWCVCMSVAVCVMCEVSSLANNALFAFYRESTLVAADTGKVLSVELY